MTGPSSSAALGGAGLLALAALLLPVRDTAGWLAASPGAAHADLLLGVWLLKGALLATAGAVAAFLWVGPLADVGRSSASPPPVREPDPRAVVVALCVLLLLGTAVRFHALGTELWLDEIDTLVRYATMPVRQLVSTYDSQNVHPLYLLLAKLSHVIFSGAEWSVRVPAVLFGVASLWATYAFARRVTSRAEALLAVFILVLSYHHVWFSQNARGYTAILFFTPIATWLFLRLAADEPVPARFVWAYAAVMALASYTHLTAVLIAVGHVLAFALGVPWVGQMARRHALGRMAVAMTLSALLTITLYALMLPQVIREVLTPTLEGASVEWTSPRWLVTETLRVLSSGVPGGLATAAVGALVLVVGVASYWRQSRLLVLSMFVPVIVTAAAVIAMRHNLWPRFFFFAASFFVLAALRGGFVIARAVFRANGERVAVMGAAALATLSAVMLPRAWQPKQQYLAAARFVQDAREAGDSVAALGIAAGVYAARGAPADWRLAPSLDALAAMERSSRRLWVLYTFPVHLRAVHAELARRVATPPYREARVFSATVGGGEIHVLLFEARPTP
ncbi:MAG TPA: glycosyltransferase family 39 protein [Gemmatimonadaceae bacterium]|nr:glycosyltransferase family 39 protein [Gemmatimonadaceae bacterium]